MNKTIKLVAVALALTTATQSFPMWRSMASRFANIRTSVAPRLNTMRASLPTWASRFNFAKSAVAVRPAFAKSAALRTAAGFGAVAAYANYAKPARAEGGSGDIDPWEEVRRNMEKRLQDEKEAEEAEQAKNALKAQQDTYRTHTHLAFRGEGCILPKAQLETVRDNMQLFAKCLSREGTHRTPEENEKTASEHIDCANLYQKLSKQGSYKDGDLTRWTAEQIKFAVAAIPGLSMPVLPQQQDVQPGSKRDVRLDINTSAPSLDGELRTDIDFEINATGRRGNIHMKPENARNQAEKDLLGMKLAPSSKKEIIGVNVSVNAPSLPLRKIQFSFGLENTEEAPKKSKRWWWPF